MDDAFSRTELLLGPAAMAILRRSSVAVFGVGGVGSFVVEALARCGLGRLALVDPDRVCPSNLNRQLMATRSTLGCLKVEALRDRILDIHPDCRVEPYALFYGPDTADAIDLSAYDYVVDAIDTIPSKILLVERARAAGVPIVSSMGAGNKLDPTRFEVGDLFQTSVCPLARIMRKELRARGISSLTVVYSREEPRRHKRNEATDPAAGCEPGPDGRASKRQVPGSISFVPSVAGLILASVVVRDLVEPARPSPEPAVPPDRNADA